MDDTGSACDAIGTEPRDPRRTGLHLGVVVAIGTGVRVVLWHAGNRFDVHPITALQLLDTNELARDPFQAFTANHIQPPLWNFLVGAVLRWSPFPPAFSFQALFYGFGMATIVLCWLLLRHLGSRHWVATVSSVVVGISPLMIFSESILMYESLVTLLITASAWSFARYVRGPSTRRFALFAAILVLGALTRATLSPLWVVAALGFALVARPPRGRWWSSAAVAVAAIVALVAPMFHNATRFGTFTLSSYAGMNWEHATVMQLPESDLQRLVADGTLSRAALVTPFAHYSAYAPLFGPCHPRTQNPVLDAFVKSNGEPNMDNVCYLAPDARATRDAVAAIRARPGMYAATVGRSVLLFSSWGAQYPLLGDGPLRRWTDIFDPVVVPVQVTYHWGFGDPQPYVGAFEPFFGKDSFSVTVALALIASIVGAMLGLWRLLRRRARVEDLIRVFIGGTVVAVMASSVLFDTFENARYRQPLDPILLGPFFALVVTGVVRVAHRMRLPWRVIDAGSAESSQ